jgi:hypothetical protein
MKEYRTIETNYRELAARLNEAAAEGFRLVALTSDGGQRQAVLERDKTAEPMQPMGESLLATGALKSGSNKNRK